MCSICYGSWVNVFKSYMGSEPSECWITEAIGILSLVLQGGFMRIFLFSVHLFCEVCIGLLFDKICFFENKKEPQRSHGSFGGSIVSRSLIGLGKQPISYAVQPPLEGRRGRRQRRRQKNSLTASSPHPITPRD